MIAKRIRMEYRQPNEIAINVSTCKKRFCAQNMEQNRNVQQEKWMCTEYVKQEQTV